jgi:hypothetical protein
VNEFGLIDKKELAPLQELISQFLQRVHDDDDDDK